ncbi:hypothetical protein LINPERHAP1_LOCUS13243 [Linum perenne]
MSFSRLVSVSVISPRSSLKLESPLPLSSSTLAWSSS